jgi:hypothetical protein
MTYRKCPGSLVIIDGLVNGKVGVGHPIAQQVRASMVPVVLIQKVVVLGGNLILVFFRFLREVGHPLGLSGG